MRPGEGRDNPAPPILDGTTERDGEATDHGHHTPDRACDLRALRADARRMASRAPRRVADRHAVRACAVVSVSMGERAELRRSHAPALRYRAQRGSAADR